MRKIAIIGSGAYGSYAASLLSELHPNWKIHIYEVGDENIKNQDEIGFSSELLNCRYDALTKGRYFGFGGATTKWGGQILTFSKNDFSNPSKYLSDIVDLNIKYRRNIFKKVGVENDYQEVKFLDGMFSKTGVWLDYFSRNLFKKFKVVGCKNVILHPHCRVTRIFVEDKQVLGFNYVKDGNVVKEEGYDFYVLAAGAFETTRIMMVSGLQDSTRISFSDHIVKKVFRIKNGTKVGNVDFGFKIRKASFITTRVIGERNNTSFFAYPVFNDEFPFFQNLKKLLFGKKISPKIILSIIKDIPSCIAFIWYFFILRRLYVYKNTWYLGLHMENLQGNGFLYLSDHLDKFNQKGASIDFHISCEAETFFEELGDMFEKILKDNNVEYERLHEKIHTEKFEDEYHPFSLYSDFDSVDDYFHCFSNMLVIHSGVLPRAGGINSTAAAFPLIEEFFREIYK